MGLINRNSQVLRLGKRAVPCMVSDRWLKFPSVSSGHFKDGEFILMKVMTKDRSGEDKIICKQVVTRENLLETISSIKSPSRDDPLLMAERIKKVS